MLFTSKYVYLSIGFSSEQKGKKPNRTIHKVNIYKYIKLNWYFFFQECSVGKYGDGCRHLCGKCKNLSQCHFSTGACLYGCEPGYQGEDCLKGKIWSKIIDECYYLLFFSTCTTCLSYILYDIQVKSKSVLFIN